MQGHAGTCRNMQGRLEEFRACKGFWEYSWTQGNTPESKIIWGNTVLQGELRARQSKHPGI